MSVTIRGFSLPEVLISMAISSVLLLGAARFLPALQRGILHQTRQQALEDDLWQRLYTVAKHLQRAGYCNGQCSGEAFVLSPQRNCAIVRWDGNSDGIWQTSPMTDADSIGFRLQNGALETQRGAATCEGKGWEKMTDPATVTVTQFQLTRTNSAGFPPELMIELSATATDNTASASARYSVTGYNL